MNTDTKIFKKSWQTKFNSTVKRSCIMIKWNQIGGCYTHFLFCVDFCTYLLLITGTLNCLQRYDNTKRNVAQSNVETVNYRELLLCSVSEGCGVFICSSKNFKYSTIPWKALAHSLGTAIVDITLNKKSDTREYIGVIPFI